MAVISSKVNRLTTRERETNPRETAHNLEGSLVPEVILCKVCIIIFPLSVVQREGIQDNKFTGSGETCLWNVQTLQETSIYSNIFFSSAFWVSS